MFPSNLFRSAAVLAVATLLTGAVRAQDRPQKQADRPHVEVVFVLDTTSSMTGLIDAAKQKIWAISNQIAGGKPTPHVKIGLVAFRDRGDAYVTKVIDLTDDLDAIHGHLMGFKAEGGGDTPESVNQALNEAVTKITWSKHKKTLKLIFLVGDAPPHMDYKDDVKYPVSCQLAVKNDILINTVQCGNHAETKKYWQEICRLGEGSYVQIDQGGGPVVVVATPFDKDLAKINTELATTTLCYGNAVLQAAGKKKTDAAKGLAAPVAAERAGFAGKSGMAASYDLLDAIKSGKVKLKDLKESELPEEMRKLKPQEREAFLAKAEKTRADLLTRAADLDRKRGKFIADKMAADKTNKGRDSFDSQVLQILARQATRANIQYAIEAKKK